MTTSTFFKQETLPVFDYLSPDSKHQLESFLLSGNTSFRQKQLLEFFKILDWVSTEDALQHRFFQKLSPGLRRQIAREILAYHQRKNETRQVNAEKRGQYKLRIIDYFRTHIPASDKALLESLRDYELDLTGRDINWRHHFTLDSFKKIDAFINATPLERQALFARFKHDVDTYKKNYDKLHHQASQECEHNFSFDDWCDLMGEEAPRSQQRQKSHSQLPSSTNPILQAFKTLDLPVNAVPDTVKKQFRQLTLKHHPDLPNGCEETMKAIVGAYQQIQHYWKQAAL